MKAEAKEYRLEKARKRQRQWYRQNTERSKARSRRWTAANKARANEVSKRWREANKNRTKNNDLLRQFGITLDQYNTLLAVQENRCSICRTEEPGGRGSFCVDHCHTTGRIRGLLCFHCNTALGHVKDNPETLRSMLQYLEKEEQELDEIIAIIESRSA